jgi:hypothetical protein
MLNLGAGNSGHSQEPAREVVYFVTSKSVGDNVVPRRALALGEVVEGDENTVAVRPLGWLALSHSDEERTMSLPRNSVFTRAQVMDIAGPRLLERTSLPNSATEFFEGLAKQLDIQAAATSSPYLSGQPES